MSCPSCQARGPVTSTLHGFAVPLRAAEARSSEDDPPFYSVQQIVPPGFLPPRICIHCGGVYFPKLGSSPSG